jgi:predicted transcriptional regulator
MACINAQGELTESAEKILAALDQPAAPDALAGRTSLPLFRVRSGLREMAEAGLVEAKEGVYALTERGRSVLPARQ